MAASKGGSYTMAVANVFGSLFTKNTIHSFNVLEIKQGSQNCNSINSFF